MPPPNLPADHAERMRRVRIALDGLSVGDAFGQGAFGWARAGTRLQRREPPPGRWPWTDDTAMALSIVRTLDRHGAIEQDALAEAFAARYRREPGRGYGAMAHRILFAISEGCPWREVSRAAFEGMGSLGNGGAMRVAPVAAYFAGDLEAAARQAALSAEVTHAHPEGQAGAVAAAVAGAWAWEARDGQGSALLQAAFDRTPEGETRRGIARAIELAADEAGPLEAVRELGNGSRITAPDTVPFCLWVAARHLRDYEEALWLTVAAGGDVDTNCAIVGGIVALASRGQGIPAAWLEAREPLA